MKVLDGPMNIELEPNDWRPLCEMACGQISERGIELLKEICYHLVFDDLLELLNSPQEQTMANKTGSHQDGDINTPMRQLFGEKLGPKPTKGLIDSEMADDRPGHLTTKNCLNLGGKPADLSSPQGTEIKLNRK